MSKESVIEHLTEENNRLREELERVKAGKVVLLKKFIESNYSPCCFCIWWSGEKKNECMNNQSKCTFDYYEEAALKEGKK